MLSVQQQLAKRRLEEKKKFKKSRQEALEKRLNASDKELLSQVFSQWREYKRIEEPIAVIQQFMRSIWYIIKMRILKKNHREPDSANHSALQINRFIILEQNRKAVISLSRDLKNDQLTILSVFLRGFVRTHSPVVNDPEFIKKMREMLSRDEFDYIQYLMGSQSFIEFFESTRKTRDDIYNGCSTARSMRIHISGLLWILFYLTSERLPKSWFSNPESDFMFVFEELRTIVRQNVQEEEERRCEIMEMGPTEQPDYCPEPCSKCGCETIYGNCFNAECMRRRESACASCGNPIEGSNVVEVDGIRLHQDCANHNQHNSHFRKHTKCSACRLSSNNMSFVNGLGFICDECIILNQ
jgi:hypothetical protein